MINTNGAKSVGKTHLVPEKNNEYQLIDFRYDKYVINHGEAVAFKNFWTHIETEEYTFTTKKPELFSTVGYIEKGRVIGDFCFPCDSRILEINNETILCENLEKTHIVINKGQEGKIFSTSSFEFNLFVGTKKLEILSYNAYYDNTLNDFYVFVDIDNSECILTDGMLVHVRYTERITLDENKIYVPSSYVIFDENGAYVKKYCIIEKKMYYKLIPIDITEHYDDFYAIEGEIYDDNFIIREL